MTGDAGDDLDEGECLSGYVIIKNAKMNKGSEYYFLREYEYDNMDLETAKKVKRIGIWLVYMNHPVDFSSPEKIPLSKIKKTSSMNTDDDIKFLIATIVLILRHDGR